MPVPPRQPSRGNMEALFNNALSSTLASRRGGGGGGDQHPETTTTTSGDVIQLEPNTNREITFRVWCHGSCARFTCASTLDEEHLPPTCPACGESEFLELVPFRETVEEHELFSEGAVWTEYDRPARRLPSPPPTRQPPLAFDRMRMIEDMIERSMNGDGNVNFFDLDDRRFEQPLSEKAREETLRRFTMIEENKGEMDGKTKTKKRKIRKGGENEKDETQCAVCLDEMKKGEEMCELKKCGHVFHYECVDEWFKSKNSCPVCRDVLEKTSTTPRKSPGSRSGGGGRGFRNASQQRRR